MRYEIIFQSMKRIFLIFTTFLVACQPNLYSLVTESPNQTYKVQAFEREGAANEPYNYTVSLQVFRGKQLITDISRFSGRDEMDSRFGNEYPAHRWISENILHLGKHLTKNQTIYDIVNVINGTNNSISYFVIRGKSEMFLAFDLPSKSTTEFKTLAQTDEGADLSWIGYAGQFANGEHISGGGMSFKIRGRYSSPAHYCVRITSDEVITTSREFEGVKFLSGVETTISPATSCGQ